MKDNENNTSLIFSSHNGHTEIVKKLLEKNANISIKNSSGNTALILASKGGYVEIVKLLLNANLNSKKPEVTNNYFSNIMKKFKDNVLDKIFISDFVNEKNNLGKTALLYAVEFGHIEIARLLLDNKADINYKDNKGKGALIYIEEKINDLEEGREKYIEMQKILLSFKK